MADNRAAGRSPSGSPIAGMHSPKKRIGRFVLSMMLSATTVGVVHVQGDEPATWQPRPLALPATSKDGWQWKPPAIKAMPEKAIPPAPIVINLPAPETPVIEPVVVPPTPAEIRQARVAEKRVEEQRFSQQRRAVRNEQPLPPSDRINIGSRKSQLAVEAVEQLRVASWAAKRGAIASAQSAATEVLQTLAALRDTQAGGNYYSQQLGGGFVAIRESLDFAGRYGPVDTGAIERLIDVHQTPALKHVSTAHLTSSRAIEAYLKFAKSRLVEATGGGPLAADAVMILADVETLVSTGAVDALANQSSLHSAELALMYRRAAVEIAPENADASAKLGRTLLKRSIPSAAKDMLLQSVRIAPTRQRMEDLLEAAAKSGDFLLVSQCEHQLASASLPSELPVRLLSAQDFARTHQAQGNQFRMAANQASPNIVEATPHTVPQAMAPQQPAYRIGARPGVSPAASGQIVDPTLPTSPQANRSNGRLFW